MVIALQDITAALAEADPAEKAKVFRDRLIEVIEIWTEHWNHDPKAFICHMTAEEIIAEVRRGRTALTRARSATHH
jgi:hypothetical protein